MLFPENSRCGNVCKSWHDVCFIIKKSIFEFNRYTSNPIHSMKLFFASVLLSLATISVAQNQNIQTMPEIILKDLNGKNKNVADYSQTGKITIISFWATWCTPCKKELSNINDLYDE